MSAVPVLAIVGRPNVGKSTLFNRLTRSRDAIVHDRPGLTRDRHYGRARLDELTFIVIDTGGFEPQAKDGIEALMARQARQAVLEADVVVFVVDGRAGLTGHDAQIATELRRSARRLLVAVNKTEGMPRESVIAEFHSLGLGDPIPISSAHGEGVHELIEAALAPQFAAREALAAADGEAGEQSAARPTAQSTDETPDAPVRVKVAVVGRPNAGKSTLINTLIGEDRLIAFDQPGTTRDAVAVEFERAGKPYTLIDTAGVRRRGKVTDVIEKFSVVKTLQAIEDCNVCVLLIDATEGVAEQDASIAGYVLEAGRAVVVAVNKWDAIAAADRARLKSELERKLHFLGYARTHMISALRGAGVGAVMRSVDDAFAAATCRLPTPKLTRALLAAVEHQQPPRRGPVRPKMRYAHQGGRNPPIVVIHGSALDAVPETYRRYLEGWFRDKFALEGTPLRIEFRNSRNPYVQQGRT
ncbi:MAG: ribosome biogenesis GTPase Der [Burkholderiaceae bacterium]|nr:ribosome biogenesis GTPase Der [Burkholderiaceae bacterium]